MRYSDLLTFFALPMNRVVLATVLVSLAAVPSSAFACGDAPAPGDNGSPTWFQMGFCAWGAEQATGLPNTPVSGDLPTAWASLTEDDQDEWLLLTYAKAFDAKEVIVHESYNTGALTRVTVMDGTKEVEVWSGTDPVGVGEGHGIAVIPVDVHFPVRRVKLYFASKDVAGWNEIDAVGLREKRGKIHWATRARASSTYAVNSID